MSRHRGLRRDQQRRLGMEYDVQDFPPQRVILRCDHREELEWRVYRHRVIYSLACSDFIERPIIVTGSPSPAGRSPRLSPRAAPLPSTSARSAPAAHLVEVEAAPVPLLSASQRRRPQRSARSVYFFPLHTEYYSSTFPVLNRTSSSSGILPNSAPGHPAPR